MAGHPPEIHHRPPSPAARRVILGMSGYRERGIGISGFTHAAPLTVPLLLSLGSPFRIALGRAPGAEDRRPSFAAGLHPGPVRIESDGGAESLQVDFTPAGAFRFFGGAVRALAGEMIEIEAVLGAAGRGLRERVAGTPDWGTRFDIVEAFILARLGRAPAPETRATLAMLQASGGTATLEAIAADTGWSRRHLSRRVGAETGLTPKLLGRLMRFHAACRLARLRPGEGWAAIAAEAGYADQSHLSREFQCFAGAAPTLWARRLEMTDPALLRADGG